MSCVAPSSFSGVMNGTTLLDLDRRAGVTTTRAGEETGGCTCTGAEEEGACSTNARIGRPTPVKTEEEEEAADECGCE